TINFRALHATKEDTDSSMKDWILNPAKLVVEDGKNYVYLTVQEKAGQYLTDIRLEKNGEFVSQEIVSKKEELLQRVIKFEVPELGIVNAEVDMHVVAANYKNTQKFRMSFDVNSMKPIEKPTYEDGEYTINFRALHATKEDTDSSMKDWILNPAKLVVEDGKNYVYLTVQEKAGQYLTDIRLEKNGGFVSQEIVSKKEELLQRVIKFEVPELGIVNAEVDMHVVAANYKNTQKFRMSFDTGSIQKVITSQLDTNGSVSLENITMPTSIQTNYNGQPISIVVPAGSNSLTVSELKSDANSLLVKISVGNLGNKTVKLTLRKPAGLAAAQVGAYHQNGDAWEYREAQVVGDNVVFETNLSAVKIAEAVTVPILSEPTVSENKVTLEWNKVSGATYELRINKKEIVSMEENNSYIATIGYNQSNLYEVRAIKDKHQSAWSNSVTATTGKKPGSEEETPQGPGGTPQGPGGTPQGPGGTPQTPGGTNDEMYTIDFKVLKDGTNNKSVMDDYTWKPAELKVKDGRNYISLTLLNSSWIKSFQTEKGDAKVVSTNEKVNTRVVQFEVPDLSKKLSATTHVVIPNDEFPGSGSYDERYTVQIQFDPSSKTVLKGSNPAPITPNIPVTPTIPVAEKAIKAKDGGKIEESGVVIQFPADSFASDFKVTVKKVTNPSSLPLADKESLVSDVLEITKDKTGDFKKAITLTLNFDNTKVDTTKHEVGLFWLNETTKKWVKLDNVKVDLKNGKVSGEVNHFTKFAVLAIDQTEQNNQPTQPETPSDFTDIKGHWAEEHIDSLAKIGAITGYPTGEFKPNNHITRAEFATVIVKAFGLDVIKGNAFNDTKNHWASDYIATAEAKGIVSGYSKTKFGPNDVITREQMALMVVRAAELQSNDSTLSFKDAKEISSWAQSAVKTAVHEKIITGYPNNTFKPKGNATRAEAVVVIVKALNK
ncbi:NEAT domain-containing protein, partial [Peribacillus loiseleuriae]